MRVLTLVVLFAVGWASPASAEKAKAKESAKIYNRAGERGQVVIKVKEGQVMRIDRKEGRWYKVRVSGRTGWIPRSKVELVVEDEMARNTRRRPFVDGRGTKRGFNGGGAPDDRVGEDATTTTDDDEDDKKPAVKKPAVDDDDDEDDKKPAVKKPDTKKPEVKKPEVKKPEPKKPEVKKPEPKKPDAKKPSADDEDGDTDGEEPVVVKGTSKDDDDEDVKDDRPKAHVKKKTVAFSEADPDSEESFTAKPDTVLRTTGNKKGKYVEVESDEGDIGFVLASDLSGGGGGSVSKKSDDDDGPSTPSGPRVIDVRARAGVTLVSQGMRTEVPGATGGDMQPDNYNLSTSAVTVSLGGTYLKPLKGGKSMVGGELGLDIAKAIPGIKVSEANTTGITIYDLNLRAMYGKVLKPAKGTAIYGRLGFHFHSFQVADAGNLTTNTAKLPSEIVKGPTLGAAFVMPQFTRKLGLRFSLDTMLIGASMQQTKGLEDGTAASAKGLDLGVGITYKWKPGMDISGAYDLNYMTYDFGAPDAMSMRGHPMTATSLTRKDVFHGVTVGISKAF